MKPSKRIELKSKPFTEEEKLKLNAIVAAESLWQEVIALQEKGFNKEDLKLAFTYLNKEYLPELDK